MTLVVSEISKHGIVVVGDSAITWESRGMLSATGGARKVHYSPKANIGFAIWGNAVVGSQQIDLWMDKFLDSVDEGEGLESVAQRLTGRLGSELQLQKRPWRELVFGIHVAGYKNGLPRLWHIHCGHPTEPPHEPRLYHDYPEDHGWDEMQFKRILGSVEINSQPAFRTHLRNGYIAHYALLYSEIRGYSSALGTS